MRGLQQLTIERRNGLVWVILPDSITLYTAASAEAEITAALDGPSLHLVLDFSRTIHLYSTGLGLIVRLRRCVGQQGGLLCLVNVSRRCGAILEQVQLHKVIPVYATDVEFEIEHDTEREHACAAEYSDFGLYSRDEADVCRVIVSGRVTEEQDLSALRNLCCRNAIRGFLFDLSNVEFLDMSGADVLVGVIEKIQLHDGLCAAFGADKAIAELAALLGIDRLMPFFPDEPAALDALQEALR